MVVMSLVAVVAPRTGKSSKMASVFLKERKICYNRTLCLDSVSR